MRSILAAHCIAARAQAEEMLRLVRVNAANVELVIQLNAQYGSIVQTSLSVLGMLMRVQAVRAGGAGRSWLLV